MKNYYTLLLKYLEGRIGFVYLALLLAILVDRMNTFLRFAIVYTDSDQTLLWQVSKDLMNGVMHGPCFYGQSYNPIVEPLFALPFLHFSLEYSTALALATTFLSIFPFLLLSFYLYKKVDSLTGLLPLIILLLMSVEYGMLTSISRGFVAGIFFAIIGLLLLAFHKSFFLKFLGGAFLGLGVYANPNCVLLMPILLPFFPNSKKELFVFLKPMILGLLLGVLLLGFNAMYYNQHAEMIIHGAPVIKLSLSSFFKVLGKLDNYFDFVTPIFWRAGWISLSLFIIISIRLWRFKLRRESITLILLFTLIVLSFSVSKISDGTNSVFFSGSRMYLAYPYLLIFVFIFLTKTLSRHKNIPLYGSLVILALITVFIKVLAFDQLLQHALRGSANTIVQVIPVKELKNTCKEIVSFSDVKTDLILANSGNTAAQLITYGCPCLIADFPKTIQPLYERRTWLMPKTMNEVYHRILIHGKDTSVWNNMRLNDLQIIKTNKEKSWLIINNKLNTRDLLRQTRLIK